MPHDEDDFPPKDRFGSSQDRFGSSQDRFGSSQDRFGSSQDRYRPNPSGYTRRRVTATREPKAAALTIGEILCAPRRFFVPLVQRAYAWHEEDALQLLIDVETAQASATEGFDDAPPYFLGSIVLVRNVGDDSVEVVDGQQRLTTLTILLALLRDLDADGEERLGRAILLDGKDRRPLPHQAVLNLRKLDAPFFFENIQCPSATSRLSDETLVANDAQAALLAATLRLRAELEKREPGERVWLAEYLQRRCYLVEVSAPHHEQADTIFRTMNLRGKDPRDSDNLKAEVIGKVPRNKQIMLCDIWEALEADLGESHFVSLISHLRMIHNPGKASKRVVAELRELLRPADDPQKFILEELEPKGRLLLDIVRAKLPAGSLTGVLAKHLRALNRLQSRDWAAAALAFLSETPRLAEEKLAFFRALERLAYSFLLQSADDITRNARYARIITAIRDKEPEKRSMAAILERMALSDHEKRTMREVLSGQIYLKGIACKLAMLRIDEELSDSDEALYSYGEVTVEHVLPVNPPEDSPWLPVWPESRDRRRWTNRLGNLALLPRKRNNAAANFDFDRKKREYFTKDGVAHFALTTTIVLESDWTPDVVARRQRKLFETACMIWEL